MKRKWFSIVMGLVMVISMVACQSKATPMPAPTATSQTSSGPDKEFKLLLIDSQTGGHYDIIRETLLTTLGNLGYQQGENLIIQHYSIEGDKDRGIQILNEELDNNYDVIYVGGTLMTTAAKEVAFANPDHVFVFASVTDPVGVGVIDDFTSAPKANFTGVSYPVSVKARFTFIKALMPEVKTIGLVYADLPQSHSYKGWVEDLLANDPEFSDWNVMFRMVDHATGENAQQQMAEAAQPFIEELDPQVDVFIAPNDDMGASQPFAEMVYATASNPLVGLTQNQVMEEWGATMVIYPSHTSMGTQAAQMIKRLFEGQSIQSIIPESPKNNGYAFDLSKTEAFGIEVPIEMIELAGDNIIQ